MATPRKGIATPTHNNNKSAIVTPKTLTPVSQSPGSAMSSQNAGDRLPRSKMLKANTRKVSERNIVALIVSNYSVNCQPIQLYIIIVFFLIIKRNSTFIIQRLRPTSAAGKKAEMGILSKTMVRSLTRVQSRPTFRSGCDHVSHCSPTLPIVAAASDSKTSTAYPNLF